MNIKKTIAATALTAAAAGALAIGAGAASAAPAPVLTDPCYTLAVQVPGLVGLTPVGPPLDLITVFHPVEAHDGWMWATAPTGHRVLLTECA
ncbi:hypothetical protein ACIQYZ_13510 [Rhodococcus erythropolis]